MVESSKQGSKRAKRLRNSMQAILRNSPSIGIHISDGSSNNLSHTSVQELPSPSTEESRKSKNMRGRTLCKGMPSDNEAKINVEWFEGQPKGARSIKSSTYMGVVVRDILSIIYDDWRKVPENKKDDLWELVEKKINEFEELSTTSEFSFKGDALAYTLGPERHGQVRGFGFGMMPSKLSLISESTTRIAELEEKNEGTIDTSTTDEQHESTIRNEKFTIKVFEKSGSGLNESTCVRKNYTFFFSVTRWKS